MPAEARRGLGRDGRVQVTEVGLGTAPLGNLFAPMDEDVASATVDAAWDAGIRFFDTAPHYGLGLAERRLGAVLRDRPRAEYVLSTKVGRLLQDATRPATPDDEGFAVTTTTHRVWDFSADGVRRSVDASLERLGLDRVDVVLMHDPDDHRREAFEQAYPALHELRDQGVVGAIGAGMNQWQMLADMVRELDIDVVLVAGRYTLLDPSAGEELLPLCFERGVGVIAGGVFNSGLLASPTGPAAGGTYDYRPADPARVARARAVATVCGRHGVTLPHAAVAFTTAHPAVTSVLLGMRSPAEVADDVALVDAPVPDDLWRELVAEDLLPATASPPAQRRP